MATTLVEPVAPWLRDLSQVLHNQAAANAFIPPADLLVDDDGVTVYMDVPGLRTENLELELENDVLTVRGERPFPYPHEDGQGPVRRIERGFGRFERTLRVPRGLDPDAIQAVSLRWRADPARTEAGDHASETNRDQGGAERRWRGPNRRAGRR